MESKFDTNYTKKISAPKVGFSIILVLVGVVLLGFNLGFIPIEAKQVFLSWPMILIAIGFISFLKKQFVGGIFFLLVGTFFLLPILAKIFPYDFGTFINLRLYWPVLLIVGGILFLFKKQNFYTKSDGVSDSDCFKLKNKKTSSLGNDMDIIRKDIMFSSSEQIVFSDDFKGGELNVIFGEIIIDLRRVSYVDEFNHLEANVIFGSIIIFVPGDWKIDLRTSSIFGNIEDKRYAVNKNSSEEKTLNTLIIKASCVFGNIEIKN